MRVTILVSLMFISVLTYDFQDYKKNFNKTYSLGEQEQRRLWFNKNYAYILEVNSFNLNYTLNVNNRTDWSTDALSSFNNAMFNINAVSDPLPQFPSGFVGASETIDWRNMNIISPVKDQGNCGCCWAFSTMAQTESVIAQAYNKIYDLSEEFLLQCTTGSSCNGGYLDAAANNVIKTDGVPLQTSYPYKGYYSSSGKPTTSGICTTKDIISIPPNSKLSSYKNLTNDQMYNLLKTGPVVVGFKAQTAFSWYYTGTYSCASPSNLNSLNHAIQVIGYDSEGNYIIKNSWGTNWGQRGYGIMDKSLDCGLKLMVYQISSSFELGRLGIVLVMFVISIIN